MNTTPILLIPFERNTGYDTGVISGALVTIGSDLGPVELSNGQKVNILLLLVLGGFCLTYHHSPTSFIIIGIYHFCDHIGGFIGRSCCWRSFRSDWKTACSGHSGYYIYWRGYWSSSLPYGMEHGPSTYFLRCNYLPILHNRQWLPDWRTIFGRDRGWFGCMHCTLVYPRIVSHPSTWKDGCFEV